MKSISKQEIANACDTDPRLFYCKRKNNREILKGFEERRELLLESLLELQRNGFTLQQMLFIHSGGKETLYTKEALLVTKSSHPYFFNIIGEGIWDFLESIRTSFQ